uniref:Uncharacterized protein n=1 Tax=Setaria italica TaxID=4555 RepID=K3ZKR7_SETIT
MQVTVIKILLAFVIRLESGHVYYIVWDPAACETGVYFSLSPFTCLGFPFWRFCGLFSYAMSLVYSSHVASREAPAM